MLPSCVGTGGDVPDGPEDNYVGQDVFTPRNVAMMMASLPIGPGQLSEVHNAVNSSSSNGYDEEYMMCDLLTSPGAGVGDSEETRAATKAAYTEPLRDLIAGYLAANPPVSTKAGADVEYYLNALSASGMQIYWPYSEDWDGEQMPLVTFDPGFGANSNYAYEIAYDSGGYKVIDSVYVDENVAASRPVWVINSNDDSGFTPMQMFLTEHSSPATKSGDGKVKNLYMKSFTMLRQYDSWFAGASEFFIKLGSVNGFYAASEKELNQYTPSVTDLMVVVKRKHVGQTIPYDAILISDFSEQLDKLAFLVTESDGGTRTSWKCETSVKIKSKTYGFD
ncbi:MAG: hypothetical protein IK030_04490, partial [Bacteroidales bacterium]|nr:hypothetical protein [Bacteroidales bacterium]